LASYVEVVKLLS